MARWSGICGVLSFAFLATSLGTDYWYIIETNPMNASDSEDMGSHSGLWRIYEGTELSVLPHICLMTQNLHNVCFLDVLYIVYSHQALAETERLVGQEGLAYIRTSFGWSLGLAWLSYGLELLTGVLLLIAAEKVKLRHSIIATIHPQRKTQVGV
uniref:Transmembrane protein 235 n=1 Tax=Amphiprion percula TaxID=161767 RepID=A0A3P8RKP6_AMPPE